MRRRPVPAGAAPAASGPDRPTAVAVPAAVAVAVPAEARPPIHAEVRARADAPDPRRHDPAPAVGRVVHVHVRVGAGRQVRVPGAVGHEDPAVLPRVDPLPGRGRGSDGRRRRRKLFRIRREVLGRRRLVGGLAVGVVLRERLTGRRGGRRWRGRRGRGNGLWLRRRRLVHGRGRRDDLRARHQGREQQHCRKESFHRCVLNGIGRSSRGRDSTDLLARGPTWAQPAARSPCRSVGKPRRFAALREAPVPRGG